MDVKLISYTPDPERLIASAARLCYSKKCPDDLFENLSDEQIALLLDIIMKNKHYSALEHAVFTFSISGISRACTHQLVRHRMASYNQQSQRYVKFFDGELHHVLPESIKNDPEAEALVVSHLQATDKLYSDLLALNIPAEDARYILPNSSQSNIVVTMNARELNHFFSLRCCNRAQWEIRELAWAMLKLVQEVAPRVFVKSGPGCLQGQCLEHEMACGQPYHLSDHNVSE